MLTTKQENQFVSDLRKDVLPAKPGEFNPVKISEKLIVWPPVVLAPMAGVTNYPFRKLCYEFGAALYVSEMISVMGYIYGSEKTKNIAKFGPDEQIKSIQLYSTEPESVAVVCKELTVNKQVDHIDFNFGCPVKKITSKGGGAAVPTNLNNLRNILRTAVQNSHGVPVTVKFRKGIDKSSLYYLDVGRISEEEGCKAVCLHARTASQLYDGHADWEAISRLKEAVSIPVFGNGDIWEASDALLMMRNTGCDGVTIGRGCLGRPWLFRDLAEMFNGQFPSEPPNFGEVVKVALRHAELICNWFGKDSGIRMIRKFNIWYTKCFPGTSSIRPRLLRATSLEEMAEIFSEIDPDIPYPMEGLRVKRGKRSGTQKVVLPKK